MKSVISAKTHRWLIFDAELKKWEFKERGIRQSDIFMLMEPDWKIIHEYGAEYIFVCDNSVSDSTTSTIQYRPLAHVIHELPDELRELVCNKI